jgi:hypothetical protein
MAHSSQIEILWEILLSLFNAAVDVIMGLFPVFEVKVNDGAMIEEIGTIRVELIADLQLLQGLY